MRDESGLEAFYNIALTPWLLWTANVEYIHPSSGYHSDAVFLGMRSQLKL
jgi:porin